MRLDKSTAGWVVALAAIAAGLVLGVLWLTPVEQRGELIGRAAAPLGTIVASLVAAVAAKIAHEAKTETKAQTETLDTIKTNTNGALTGGIEAAVRKVLAERDAAASNVVPAVVDAIGRHAAPVELDAPDPAAELATDPAGALA